MNQKPTIVLVAGATGMLGHRIASSLLDGGEAEVRALVRPKAAPDEQKAKGLGELEARGMTLVEGDLSDPESLRAACESVNVIVSAVNGEREAVVEGQKNLIRAAETAGVRRMIPSDYSPDHFKLDYGDNHNLDMRKEVADALEESNIAPTSVLNGVFTEVLITLHSWQLDPKEGYFYYYGDGEQPYHFRGCPGDGSSSKSRTDREKRLERMKAIRQIGEVVPRIDTIKVAPEKQEMLLEGLIPQAKAAEPAGAAR